MLGSTLTSICVLWTAVHPAPALHRPFTLTTVRRSETSTQIRVTDRSSHRRLFTWQTVLPSKLAWSPDGRSLAVIDDRSQVWTRRNFFRLIVWRAGQPVRVFDGAKPLYLDSFYSIQWSPDGKTLLLHGPGNWGALTLGTGYVWSFDPTLKSLPKQVAGSAISAKWLDNRRIRTVERAFWEHDPRHPNAKNYADRIVITPVR